MSKTVENFRNKKSVNAEVVETLLNSPLPELDQAGTTNEFNQVSNQEDEFTRVREENNQVDKFFKFDQDGVEFIGRFMTVWTADSEGPFEGIAFTEGRGPQDANSTTVLIPTHSQLVRYFTENPTPGVLYKIVRLEKVDLKGGKTFVKFAIYQSSK